MHIRRLFINELLAEACFHWIPCSLDPVGVTRSVSNQVLRAPITNIFAALGNVSI